MTACMNRFARPALLAAAAILGAVCLAPMPAAAQSAEETVAFMLWGLEQGAQTKRVADNQWEAEDHNGDRSSVGIQRLTDCRFRVSGQVRRAGAVDVLELDYILDFASVHDYSAWFANGRDQRIIVKIEGKSWYSKTVRSRATGRALQSISAGSVDAYVAAGGSVERLQGAYAHFRHAFCRVTPQR
jgi:hypothetical protein